MVSLFKHMGKVKEGDTYEVAMEKIGNGIKA